MLPQSSDLPSVRRLRQYEMAEKLGHFGHWYWTIGSEEIVWSAEAHCLFGVDADGMDETYAGALSVLPDEVRIRLEQCMRRAVIERDGFVLDVDYAHPDGAVHCYHLIGEAEVGPDGRTTGLLGVVQDITETRRISAALEIANERRNDYIEMTTDWMWEMDADLRYTYVTWQVETALGLKPEALIGKRRRDLLKEGDELWLEMEMHLVVST